MSETAPSLLAIGAHTGDAEVTMGAIIAAHTRRGAKATICHVTAGEGGHKAKSPAEYLPQRIREAEASAKILKADLVIFPYADLGFAGGPECVARLTDLIREKKPEVILAHWPGSFHEGHSHAAICTQTAVWNARNEKVKTALPPHAVKAVYCPENWEDPFDFTPDLYVDVSEDLPTWEASCREHELFTGQASSFRYLDYYRGAMAAHGAVAGCAYAVAVRRPYEFIRKKVPYLTA